MFIILSRNFCVGFQLLYKQVLDTMLGTRSLMKMLLVISESKISFSPNSTKNWLQFKMYTLNIITIDDYCGCVVSYCSNF